MKTVQQCEVGEHDGLSFFSMDYVEGRDLAELTRHQPLPARTAAKYLTAISEQAAGRGGKVDTFGDPHRRRPAG